jgi:enterochelin esterase-like enzyme
VPAFPPRLEPLTAGAPAPAATRARRASALRPALTALLGAALVLAVLLTWKRPVELERILGVRSSAPAAKLGAARAATATAPLPTLLPGPRDASGSAIDAASYRSAALAATGSFHVYLPPGFAASSARYPVLYLLHGNDQPATAFLALGLQERLDRLIAAHEIPPLIAVMIQGGRGANNWRGRYESYVLEVQQLVDRMLPTVTARSARAIAGDSMGGYGAMNIALGNPQRFSVVESWLGFFNGLDDELRAATPTIERHGLHAYLYGGVSDPIADSSENTPFAARLRAAGASAHGAVYAGGHTMVTLQEHLTHMLRYAGQSLAANAPLGAPVAGSR